MPLNAFPVLASYIEVFAHTRWLQEMKEEELSRVKWQGLSLTHFFSHILIAT